MKEPKATLRNWLRPELIVFGFSIFNFALIWRLDRAITFACVVCPWYHPWSYTNEPSLLLVAAALLLFRRVWSYLGAIGLIGYMAFHFVYIFTIWEGTWMEEWAMLRKYEPYFVGSWESQYVFGFIILALSIFHFSRAVFVKVRG